jgi:hypothetical protein
MKWSGGIVEWIEGDTAFISVVFSWKLTLAYQRAVWLGAQGYKVRAGGPAVTGRMKNYLGLVANTGGSVEALIHHNPLATKASCGCPVGCWFCIVPRIEGKTFTLLPDFTPRPILCDNNLSALPVEYQDFIIDKYQRFDVVLKDCNSGFEPKTFDEDTYHRWKKIYRGRWRFGYDETKEEADVYRMTQILKGEQPANKKVYVLIGNEPFEACYRRIMQVIEWGCEPFVHPFIAPYSLSKNPSARYDWTIKRLRALSRWSNRWLWRSIPFADYK